MLADPKFKEWPEDQMQRFIELSTQERVKDRMTEAEARQYIYDRTHPERPGGYPVGVFYSWQEDKQRRDLWLAGQSRNLALGRHN